MAASEDLNHDQFPVKSALAVAVSMAVSGHAEQAQAQTGEDSTASLEEITVTARKREESMQNVAASIQAITGSQLKRQGLLNMEDVVRFLPNVTHIGGVAGANKVIFRGVSDNPNAFIAASSAAIFIDEQPLTQFSVNPEPRLVDMERVESLAGPQGTLYGDSSQSGTLRFITNKPDPTAFSANVDMMLRSGSESSESYDVSAYVNIPVVEDKFALRLVGFSARDGGFVDNVFGTSPMRGTYDNSDLVQEDINEVNYIGGRAAAKWFVNDNWSVMGSVIAQQMEADGLNDYDPTIGDLQTVKFYNDLRDDDWWQGALTIEGSFGNVDFISVTSYFDRKLDYQFDRTVYAAYFNYNFCPLFATYCWSGQTGAETHYYGYGPISVVDGVLYFNGYAGLPNDQDTISWNRQDQSNDRFTQEFRFQGTGDNYRWIVGAFYEEKSETWTYDTFTPDFLDSLSFAYWTSFYDPSGGVPAWWRSSDSTDWEQWAVFGNLNYDFNDRWSAEIGLRYFDQDMDRFYYVDKTFVDAPDSWPDSTSPQGGNSDVVPKVSITHRFDEDKLIYVLYSEGWRAGGQNRNRTPFTAFPQQYDPDLLKNFEIGTKTRWLDDRLQVNATLYFGQWEDYQIELVDPSFRPCEPGEVADIDFCNQPFQVLVGNVGDAEQTGVEFDLQAVPTENLDFGLSIAWVDAKTSESFVVSQVVPKGRQLPNVPEWKMNTFLQYHWPVNFLSDGEMYIRGQYTWQDDSINQLEDFQPVVRELARGTFLQPSYGIADIKLGLRGSAWVLEAFVNNVTDERAVLYNDDLIFEPFWGRRRVTTNRPREYGVRLSYSWD